MLSMPYFSGKSPKSLSLTPISDIPDDDPYGFHPYLSVDQ